MPPMAPDSPRGAVRRSAAFAPGRVNLIGEFTDYNDGLALPFAIGVGVVVRATALAEPRIEALAADLGARDRYRLGRERPAPHGWRAFVRGITAELSAAGLPVVGAQLEIEGTVPRGAGLSSSAALEVALALALLDLADAPAIPPLQLARICSRVENEWVGAKTGLLDQLASLCGRADAAVRIDFRSGVIALVPIELGDWRLVSLDSGERHAHAESGYNERRRECTAACAALGIASLRDLDAEMLTRLPAPLDARARHIFEENLRVDAAVAALTRGDLPELGRLLDASHASQRDLFAVSTPAVEATVTLMHAAGAAGARMVGGGFGGHVLGLLPPGVTPPTGAYELRPGPGARVL
jgi:galactokinase